MTTINNLYGIILAGGSGTRFWPMSRSAKPKQFLNICGDYSMLQMTFNRLSPLIPPDKILIAGNQQHKDLINEQLPVLSDNNILLEPQGKNTALAIALTAKILSNQNPDAIMLIVASDHEIKKEQHFLDIIKEGVEFLRKNKEKLLLFGIVPDRAATGYGYIEKGTNIEDTIYNVERFVEKPNTEKAQEFLESGKYLWNSGMFMWRADTILDNIKKYMPKMYEQLNKCDTTKYENIKKLYGEAESQSIDYGVLEKADNVCVIPANIAWNDVGSWDSVEFSNFNNENSLQIDSRDILVKSDKFVAAIGVSDLIIIETDDAILICNKDRTQDVKKIVDELKNKNKTHLL